MSPTQQASEMARICRQNANEGSADERQAWEGMARRIIALAKAFNYEKPADAALPNQKPVEGGAVAWITPDAATLWGEYIITDGEHVAIAQKAEADYGGTYWSAETGDGAIMWEPTRCISLTEDDAHPSGLAGAVEVARKALEECRDAEMNRRKKLKSGAPASDYTDARLARVEAALAALSTSAKETGQ